MSYFQSFSICYDNNHEKADDSSTVFDADTVMPREVPSLLPPLPPLPPLPSAITTEYHQQQAISSTSSHESPPNTISELLRRINSQHSVAVPSTTTATAARSEEMSRSNHRQSSSSSSSKKRPIITNNSVKRKQLQENSTSKTNKKSSTKRPRRSSRVKRQPQDQNYVDKSDSEVEDENELEDYEPNEAVINQSSPSQTSTTKRQRQNELKWKSKFAELRAYKQLHGNTDLSLHNKDYKQLRKWVSKQRHSYKMFKANKKSQITSERIEKLESIGFEWVAPNQVTPRNESAWNKRFNELKAYKEKYGRTNVPLHFKENKQLGKWVSTQRYQYKNFQENRKGKISKERIQTLESIGFDWVAPNQGGPRNESRWKERFDELSAYKELHGHTNVPTRWENNIKLGLWVMTQRTEYRNFKANKRSSMSNERIKMLESIDFEWVAQNDESAWNKRFNELKEYKEKYGRTNVPQDFKDNQQLGRWVKNQRTAYKKFQENGKKITLKRIEMLDSIGFEWECRPARPPRS